MTAGSGDTGWRPPRTAPEAFEAFAKGVEHAWPEASDVLRRCARDPLALSLVPSEPTWDVPHRVVASVRWLALRGEAEDFEAAADPWRAFREIIRRHRERIEEFVRERPVQTNVVQRCFALLPLFLTVASRSARPLRIVELGTSAGLNLAWDRYRYRYERGGWGARGALELSGEERAPVPAELLATQVEVRSRLGIDLEPVDVASEDGVRLLESFVRAGAARERLREAARVVRADPPELLRGDYLELLPDVLAAREDTTLTVVFQTLSTVYLDDDGRARLRGIIDAAGATAPLAWISTPTPEEHGERRGDYPLELALWPGGERRIVARMSVGADWIEWIGDSPA